MASDNGLTLAEIKSRSKVAAICKPRQHAFAELLKEGFSAAGIGRFFGLDHSTVLHGADAARKRQ
jgi:chromosomal replication initiation ATPase DnaA